MKVIKFIGQGEGPKLEAGVLKYGYDFKNKYCEMDDEDAVTLLFRCGSSFKDVTLESVPAEVAGPIGLESTELAGPAALAAATADPVTSAATADPVTSAATADPVTSAATTADPVATVATTADPVVLAATKAAAAPAAPTKSASKKSTTV